MKISALYFLNYPDRLPEDALVAASEVRVEIGKGHPTLEVFDATYSFTVQTLGFLQREIAQLGKEFIVERSAIIVSRFDPELIEEAIQSVLNQIEYFGTRVD
jgi:5-formaminoimidazole-4-carboxamide-1-beta-D-ribofuranosyl 5'-monophosphate synthetase